MNISFSCFSLSFHFGKIINEHEQLTFVRIKICSHSLRVLRDNWSTRHSVQHLHHLRHDILRRLQLNGFDFDTWLGTMKSNKIAAVMAQDSRSTMMLAVYTMEILPTLPIDVAIANGANLHKRTIPKPYTVLMQNFNTHVNHMK